jgi:galactonate dehydratase
MIDDLVDQALVGHDPYNAEELFDRIYGRAGYRHVPELTKVAILSAFDIACWDIVGKHLGQPVHRLLGGRVRDRIRTYTYLYAAPSHVDLGHRSPGETASSSLPTDPVSVTTSARTSLAPSARTAPGGA